MMHVYDALCVLIHFECPLSSAAPLHFQDIFVNILTSLRKLYFSSFFVPLFMRDA